MTPLLSVEDLAERLAAPSVEWVRQRVRDENWPCVRFTRKTVKFTEEQVEQIVARYTTKPEPVAPDSGQTKASRRRAS